MGRTWKWPLFLEIRTDVRKIVANQASQISSSTDFQLCPSSVKNNNDKNNKSFVDTASQNQTDRRRFVRNVRPAQPVMPMK